MSIMGTKRIPFNLQDWLADKSQKVVTRDGKSVRIVCTDSKAYQPIVALITHTYEGGGTFESVETEAKCLADNTKTLEKEITRYWEEIFDDDCPNYFKAVEEAAKHFYNLGKSEALKDLPRWKKISQDEPLPCDAYLCFNGNYLHYMPNAKYVRAGLDGYYLPKTDIEKLPKE